MHAPTSRKTNLQKYTGGGHPVTISEKSAIEENPTSTFAISASRFCRTAGSSTITITYAQTLDQTIGDAISLIALATLLLLLFRKPKSQPSRP